MLRNVHPANFLICSASPARSGEKEDDLFEWDPKKKVDSENNGAAVKRRRGATKESKPQRKKKAPGANAPPVKAYLVLPKTPSALQVCVDKTSRAIDDCSPDLALIGADRLENSVMDQASGASHLANAPHDGPDEPLLLRHDPTDGVRLPSDASVGICWHFEVNTGAPLSRQGRV